MVNRQKNNQFLTDSYVYCVLYGYCADVLLHKSATDVFPFYLVGALVKLIVCSQRQICFPQLRIGWLLFCFAQGLCFRLAVAW